MQKPVEKKFAIGTVIEVKERFSQKWVSGVGKDAVTEDVSTGWWVTLDTLVSIGFGSQMPDCRPGDTLSVVFSRSLHEGEKNGQG